MDALLAPAFPFGGMEHVGAIFYNETQFVFREPPTLSQRLGREQTIYHEVAHQWFGDLVTMRWFDDLWLKEGFATYMAARMQAELAPESGAWKTFYLRNKPTAYATDATSGTTPVWQELANLDLAKSNYGPIVYNKAPSILKQLNFLVGDTAFRAGVQTFLTRHAYSNATWRDLLTAIEEASGTPLKQFGEQYILRAGMPVVETRMEAAGDKIRALRLVQRPARALPGDPGGWWPGRVRVRLAYHDRDDVVLPVTFAGTTTVVEGAAGLPLPDYVWSNDGDYGYGLFLLDDRSAERVAANVGATRDDLLRAQLWGALWDRVREGRMPAARFVETAIRELPRERDEQIADAGAGPRIHRLTLYLRPTTRPAWRRHGSASSGPCRRLGAHLRDAQGVAGRAGGYHAHGRGTRRAARVPGGAPQVRREAGPAAYALGDGGHAGRARRAEADALIAAEAARDSSAEGPRRAFVAGAAHPQRRACARILPPLPGRPGAERGVGHARRWPPSTTPRTRSSSLPHLRASLDRLEWIRRTGASSSCRAG
jgi:aminopeptidase N